MPRYRVNCDLLFGGFFAGLGTDNFDDYGEFDFFPYPWTPEEAFGGFEVLEETTDPVGCHLELAISDEATSDTLLDRMREPTEAEYEDVHQWGGLSVSGYGSCHVVVEALSEDEVTDELVKSAMPARFYATDVEDLSFGVADL